MFREVELKNGLKVVAEIRPEAKSLALGYFIRTGSRDETPEESGVSHFLEHMVFKGPEGLEALTVNRLFDEMGAQYNAFTSEEATVYYGAVLPEYGLDLLRLFTRLLFPALRAEDFETERQVILEEIARYRDRPNYMAFEWAREAFFNGHPLGNSVLGTPATIRAMTPEGMRAYHRRRYRPGNALLALSGRVDWERTLETVEALTEGWTGTADRAYPPLNPRTGRMERTYERANRLYLVGLYPGVAYQEEARFAASVLAYALGEEGSGRLHFALVDKGLAEAAGLGHEEADGAGFFYAYAQGDPKNRGTILEALGETLRAVEREGLEEEELARARTALAARTVFAGETSMQRLFHLGLGYLYTGRPWSLEEVKDRILKVDQKAIGELLERGFFRKGLEFLLLPHGA